MKLQSRKAPRTALTEKAFVLSGNSSWRRSFTQNLCAHVLTNLRARIRSPYLGLHERDQVNRLACRTGGSENKYALIASASASLMLVKLGYGNTG